MTLLLPEVIAADGLVLRTPRIEDAPDVARSLADQDTSRFIAADPQPTLDEWARQWTAKGSRALGEGGRAHYVVTDETTGELLGAAALRRVAVHRRQAELGYWTAPWARRRGVASTAARALTQAGFDLGLGRVEAMTEWANIGSQRVALAAGFRREGVRRGAGSRPDGSRYDMIAFSRLEDDPPGPTPRVIPDLPGGRLTDGVVVVRPLFADDAEMYHILRSLPEVMAVSVGGPGSLAETVARCERAYPLWLAGERADMLIFDAETGAFAGDIGFWYMERATGGGMIGYGLMPEFRGRGFATRAARLVSDWVFAAIGVQRLIAGTAPENVGSQRVLERAGFVREAYLRNRLPGPDGGRIDDIQYVRFPPGTPEPAA